MKTGASKFEYYIQNFETLLDKASKQKNPALFLYRNNARTSIFMLEGLCKLYAGLHNRKKFEKLKMHFKLLEDGLGIIDYYDAFAKEFTANKKIPRTITAYLQAQLREKLQHFNELLTEKGWINADHTRIKKIRAKLNKVDWQNEKEEVANMLQFYEESILIIKDFVAEKGAGFTNIETDLHELRRKLRWLSIYPQAIRGSIQLTNSKAPTKSLQKYLTSEIIHSPYNKMPDAANNRHFLLLEQKYFYSLSWMIASLGNLKDAGLRVIAIKEAIQISSSISDEMAYKKAYQLAGKKQADLPSILKDAGKIITQYFKEANLDKLIAGTAAVL